MSTFESGFAAGERAAFDDRRRGATQKRKRHHTSEWWVGFWAAYTPRSATWASLARTPAKPIAYAEAA